MVSVYYIIKKVGRVEQTGSVRVHNEPKDHCADSYARHAFTLTRASRTGGVSLGVLSCPDD